jgi:isocitrate lyase
MLPSQPVRTAKGYFTIGSTKDEVLAVQGAPTEFTDLVWYYGSSSVFFRGNRVTRWDVSSGSPLKVQMLPSQPVRTAKGYFTIGSTKDEVLAVQGTPSEFSDLVWKYGSSSVFFSGKRVTSWDVWPGSPLRVRLGSAMGR